MSIDPSIFKSYSIIGTMDKLSVELAEKVGAAVVHVTGAKTVAVGRDMRLSSPELAAGVIRGITNQGAKAVDIGMCTTTMYSFAVSDYDDIEASVMITASHNPAEYNGIKMNDSTGFPLSGESMKDAVMEKEYPAVAEVGEVERREIMDDYLKKVFDLAKVPSLKGMKVAVDAGNGMSGITLVKMFERMDAEFYPLYLEPDGNFPNHEANPVKEETLTDLKNKIREIGADFGAAFDGDGDRIGFVDDQGETVRGDILLAMLATEYLKDHPGGKVYTAVNQSWIVRDAVEAAGGKVVMNKVGRTHAVKWMKSEGGVLGGEVSGHFFFKEFNDLESSEFVFLMVLKMVAEQGKPFSEIMAPYRKYIGSGEINFEVEDKQGTIQKLEDKFKPESNKFIDIDGIRLEFDDWWFNVRASNTEPLIRLTVEAKTQELLDTKTQELTELITNA
ncbi:MAG: phosphomannomutase/phosphoglucomutase [Candidatus Uhrbacteria bacterium]|nr:phosphomannomutase/phosphoglucomutase [Patescibacteria group bacterium]MBU1907082.1 phosphomannomutase/phosphoglucomutase [Patescibacteria group bacterium]